jgi:hypothetical protein
MYIACILFDDFLTRLIYNKSYEINILFITQNKIILYLVYIYMLYVLFLTNFKQAIYYIKVTYIIYFNIPKMNR